MSGTFEEWLQVGLDRGWVGPVICETHDGPALSEDEERAFYDGGDECVHVLRVYDDAAHRDAVRAAHSPTVWREANWRAAMGMAEQVERFADGLRDE